MKKTCLLMAFFAIIITTSASIAQNAARAYSDYYQISVYHIKNSSQVDSLSSYLQNTYIKQLHQLGISKVGVFLPIANDTSADKRIIVWIPFKSLNDIHKIAPGVPAPGYTRMENILLTAFEKAPRFKVPILHGPRENHIFELRSYESPTEERYISKVKMFNAGGEVSLFARLNFNAVFYAHVLAGSRMPNLMYMTSFDNQIAHDEHWKAFSNDAAWKKLSAMPEYQKNVSKADILLMHPASYSDIY
ncbi:NIPSNAP family protein [Mucilaginibacter sp. Bleaf8]|uniref:NIPSNAP family protein n=1 Tax=Mucilaginibacter sp. Bleaf8 TaxID=2834430 RepID=UPI001BCE8B44|nr:NIPSNAP family protein [Mucilaginibacter sp. Bleaf8]MBS7567065.1 NIPSNAP family protein [Mucilaginibacter sp. Bleaf8]